MKSFLLSEWWEEVFSVLFTFTVWEHTNVYSEDVETLTPFEVGLSLSPFSMKLLDQRFPSHDIAVINPRVPCFISVEIYFSFVYVYIYMFIRFQTTVTSKTFYVFALVLVI